MIPRESKTEGVDRWGFPIPGYVAPARVVAKPISPLLAGLRRLCEVAGSRRLLLREIAQECQVDKETIRLIHEKALRKLRARLAGDVEFRGIMRQLGKGRSGEMFEAALSRSST